MSLRSVLDIERISILDTLLPQRWARRLSTKLEKAHHRFTGLFGRGGQITDIPGVAPGYTVLQGLEVGLADASTITVTPGQLLTYPTAGNLFAPTSFATRPASYTFQDPVPDVLPARPEGDDDSATIYDLGHARPVPFTFGAALAVSEWWIVYATRSTATTETDTARVVFNETTGNFDPATQAKVTKPLLTLGIARGPSSAGFPAIPGGSYPLGALWLDAGATNLSAARVFDLRLLREATREPNEIGGCWSVETGGTPVWRGHAWAHHRGELLEARALGGGVSIADLCSPGATWDNTASPTAPKIAWLYLARAANGTVPRWKQYGASAVASNALTDHKFYQAGVLVLSPVRPRLGLGNAKNETAGRWDMQSSATIALPNGYNDSNPPAARYDFSGQVAAEGDAICVGMVVYDGIAGGLPTVRAMSVTADGWARGDGISLRSKADEATAPMANATLDVTGTAITLGATCATIGGYAVPIDGVEVSHWAPYSEARIFWQGGSRMSGTDGAAYVYATDIFPAALPHVLSGNVVAARGQKLGTGDVPSGANGVSIAGVRLPFGVPLFT